MEAVASSTWDRTSVEDFGAARVLTSDRWDLMA